MQGHMGQNVVGGKGRYAPQAAGKLGATGYGLGNDPLASHPLAQHLARAGVQDVLRRSAQGQDMRDL